MKIFISERCEAITGSLGSGFGYHIQRRKNGFFGKRNTKGIIPRDGHLRFIIACAELARMKTHLVDVNVSRNEMTEALYEAGFHNYIPFLKKDTYNADDVVNLIITFGL